MLIKTLRETLKQLDFEAQRRSMGFKARRMPLDQVITGEGAAEQAGEYCRELAQRGLLKGTPVPLDCNQPMTDDMVQRAFKEAKTSGMLIAMNLEHLARQETFSALALRAVSEQGCAVILCGTKESIDALFAGDPGFRPRFPSRVDMQDPEILRDLAALEERQKAETLEKMMTVQTPVQPMKPLKFGPKLDG